MTDTSPPLARKDHFHPARGHLTGASNSEIDFFRLIFSMPPKVRSSERYEYARPGLPVMFDSE